MKNKLIPICAWCKRIKITDSLWERIEKYLTDEGITDCP